MDAPQWPPAWAACLQLGDRRKALGLAFIVAVAVIWVGASFVVQGIEEQGAHPAVLTLVANSLFAIYVPIYFGNLRWRRRRAEQAAAQQQQHAAEAAALVPAGAPQSDEEGDTLAPPPGLQAAAAGGAGGAPPMPLRQLFRAALVVAPLWYAAQLTFNLSLSKTSVTSNTILSSTSALFTFLFAVALLAEAFTLPKLGFILLLIAGAQAALPPPPCRTAPGCARRVGGGAARAPTGRPPARRRRRHRHGHAGRRRVRRRRAAGGAVGGGRPAVPRVRRHLRRLHRGHQEAAARGRRHAHDDVFRLHGAADPAGRGAPAAGAVAAGRAAGHAELARVWADGGQGPGRQRAVRLPVGARHPARGPHRRDVGAGAAGAAGGGARRRAAQPRVAEPRRQHGADAGGRRRGAGRLLRHQRGGRGRREDAARAVGGAAGGPAARARVRLGRSRGGGAQQGTGGSGAQPLGPWRACRAGPAPPAPRAGHGAAAAAA